MRYLLTMKDFLKPTKLKIGLTLGILGVYFIEGVLYSIIRAHNFMSTGEIGKTSIGLETIHYIFQTVFIPYGLVNNILIKFGKYFFSSEIDFINYLSAATIILISLLIFYCYFLGCLISFLIKKEGFTLKAHPERK